MASPKALIVFALVLAVAFFVVAASAEDPQPNKQGGGGPPDHGGGHYPPWNNGGGYNDHRWDGDWHHPYPHHCRWGCCHRDHRGFCRRCC
ncbi:hypothetical protein GUJ93_ZPchr0002g24973 [Zizania palustris]|uniref:Uncharacterized protein n=1 Tax=Zizania palustris TaxID=103762 RepID=A0A8J5VW30_ZIZPA|nr:hypothetical protein GUJ93_ZPchr0002g24973 [Zizania palustris]